MRIKWKMTVACMKMFFREKEAVFWTLFLPLFMVVLFGFVKFDQIGKIRVGVVNEAGARGQSFVKDLQDVNTLEVATGLEQPEMQALTKGDRDLVLVVPAGFPGPDHPVIARINDAKPQETQLGKLLIQQVLEKFITKRSQSASAEMLRVEPVRGRKLTYMDFLLPGILAMSIMQMGVFSVSFVFVDLKKRGILRRLRVTPINTNDFILAQVATRLVVLLLQILVLTVAGTLFFDFHLQGSLWNMFVVGVLGAVVFLAIGFAVAGVSKSEDQVAPLANVITLPMLLLSGVFFSRASLPGFAHVLTEFFPLTFLADALRSIALDGASLAQVSKQILGLGVWSVVCCFLAIKLFRWE